ncbi:DNA-binding protein [Escherichia coli]|uniref:DNA-binding protein n=1 Tax=Enterobacteriaceae TaxID=543 RepID=UPI0003EF6631|nr:DNA-binding protein [Escherichia coli]MCH6933234.1 DNA-binding protein [Escherichia coli]OON52022.1 DNA-binding protein [Klebsiella pneumoniae]
MLILDFLHVRRHTLQGLEKNPRLRLYDGGNCGGAWRFRQSEIDRWINDQIQAGRKNEVIRTDEQPKSAKHPVLPGRAIHSRRQTE